MKRFFVSVLCILGAFAFMAVTPKAAEKCVFMSKEQLVNQIEPYIKRAIVVPDKMRDSYFVSLNKVRKQNGTFEIVTDEMIIFETKRGTLGIEIFYEGCLLPFVKNILSRESTEVFFKMTGGDDILTLLKGSDA